MLPHKKMAKQQIIQPRILKGFRDSLPKLAIARQAMIRKIEDSFKSFGFAPIDTPALEYSEILLGKGSAETDKQLYRFMDNGERDVALRFDLTIPLARFSAMHINEIGTPFKRYQIAPVWRAEKPQRGRYREFIQCDIDIIGSDSRLADAEIIAVIDKALDALNIAHRFRLNNRKILSGLLEEFGLLDKSAAVLRAIDKLEKLGREVVIKELESEAGLDKKQIDRLLGFVKLSKDKKNAVVVDALKTSYANNELAKSGIAELEAVLGFLAKLGVKEDNSSIDLSIARGLDYYTGIIFETEYSEMPEIGSISSGGRYDNLTGIYSKQVLPGVGGSIGLDRILGAYEELGKLAEKSSSADVLVCIVDGGTESICLNIANSLRDSGIATETYLEKTKLAKQLKYANHRGIGIAIIAGQNELAKNVCGVKNLASGEQSEVKISEVSEAVKKILSK